MYIMKRSVARQILSPSQWCGSVWVIIRIRIRIRITKILHSDPNPRKLKLIHIFCVLCYKIKKHCRISFKKCFKTWWKKWTFINLLTQNSFAKALFCTFRCPGSGSASLHTDQDPDPASLPQYGSNGSGSTSLVGTVVRSTGASNCKLLWRIG